MQNNATTYFFELLQMAVGRREGLSATPVKEEWKATFQMAREQALVGVFTDAVCRLPEEMRPPRKPLARLCSEVMMIEDTNKVLFRKCCDLTTALAADGFDSCVLKGQGMAMLYPKPLLRQSGDIDVWMKPLASGVVGNNAQKPAEHAEEPIEDTLYNYARTQGEIDDACYHHLGIKLSIAPAKDGELRILPSDNDKDEVEMHFRPSFMFSPRHNKRMQQWFDEQWPAMKANSVTIPSSLFPLTSNLLPLPSSLRTSFHCPTPQFNVIFALTHIYRHLFDEGIGLRQLLDYYYVLMAFNAEIRDNGATKEETISTLHSLGLYGLARAVMYVLNVVFALPEAEMLVPMDTRCGKFLLKEILQAGNFGKFDPRFEIPANETPLHKFVRKQSRGLRLLRYFPGEELWQPYFRIWHRRFRLSHGWIASMKED